VVHANYKKGFILVRDDEGRDFCYIRRPSPRGPSADAEKLHAWRLANGHSQKAAAKILNCSDSSISHYERSHRPIPKWLLTKLELLGAGPACPTD
jgi:DNA-binding XRE family transcriptional regulator